MVNWCLLEKKSEKVPTMLRAWLVEDPLLQVLFYRLMSHPVICYTEGFLYLQNSVKAPFGQILGHKTRP